MFKDSWEHSNSIFYEGWTTTDKYGPLDEATIRLLYQPQLEPGMSRSQVRSLYLPTDYCGLRAICRNLGGKLLRRFSNGEV